MTSDPRSIDGVLHQHVRVPQQKPERKAFHDALLVGLGSAASARETTEGHGPRGSWTEFGAVARVLIWHVCVQALANDQHSIFGRSQLVHSKCD